MLKISGRSLILLASFLILPVAGFCQDAPKVQWGKSTEEVAKSQRVQVESGRGYYEPDALKKEGDTISFRVFKSFDSSLKDAGVNYLINCSSQEISSAVGEGPSAQWKTPVRMLAGEPFYTFAKNQCGWGPGFGAKIKSFFD
jgi:hypothetical protein